MSQRTIFTVAIPGEPESNLVNFISWRRLARDLFPDGHEIKANEVVCSFDVSEDGLTYHIARKATP